MSSKEQAAEDRRLSEVDNDRRSEADSDPQLRAAEHDRRLSEACRVETKGSDTPSRPPPLPGRKPLNQRGQLPLNGLRLLILRGGPWGEQVAARVRERGGEPVMHPLIEIVHERTPVLLAAVERWNTGGYDWVILTSANAVAAVAAAGAVGALRGSGPRSRIAVVGPGTAAAACSAGITVDLMPESDFSTTGLIAALEATLGAEAAAGAEAGIQSFLLPLSNLSDDRLQTRLRAAGHLVERVTAYRTVEIAQHERSAAAFAEALIGCDAVLVTSGSAARALAARLDPRSSALPKPAIAGTLPVTAAIGAPTAAALAGAGIQAQIVARTQTIDGLLDAVAAHFAAHSAHTADPHAADPHPSSPSQK